MKFGKRRNCQTAGYMGETYLSCIEAIVGNSNLVGHIYFTPSGKARYVDMKSLYDYTPGDLKAILERMQK